MEVSKELFDEFIQWLKRDGLIPRKSERLWKKTIFSKLINDDKRTIENWEDFLNDHCAKQLQNSISTDFDENCLIGIVISVNDLQKTIKYVVKGETMSRIFFEDGTDIDVDNSVPMELLDTHARNQHVN